MGAVIAAQGYAIAFALAAAFPLLAIPLVPVPPSSAPKHQGKP
jgi:hypothetical protein